MAVVHDYVCAAHGGFESKTGVCPHGCDKAFVQKVFLKAPGMTTGRTKNIDKDTRQLAMDFKMTDMSNRGGNGVGRVDQGSAQRVEQARQMQEMFAPRWGSVATGDSGITQALAQHKVMPDNALSSLKPILTQPKPLVVKSSGSIADVKP